LNNLWICGIFLCSSDWHCTWNGSIIDFIFSQGRMCPNAYQWTLSPCSHVLHA